MYVGKESKAMSEAGMFHTQYIIHKWYDDTQFALTLRDRFRSSAERSRLDMRSGEYMPVLRWSHPWYVASSDGNPDADFVLNQVVYTVRGHTR